MSTTTRTLQAIKFDRDNIKLEILDQLLLPYSTSYIPINNIEDAFKAIKLKLEVLLPLPLLVHFLLWLKFPII